MRHQYHLDQSFIAQYLIYLKGIVTGNFGTSYSGRPVSEVMAQAFPVTIRLALLALLFEAVFGIGAGLIAGLRRGGFFDATLLVASLIVIAIPIFVIGFVVQIVFGVKLGWINPTVGPEAKLGELIVPALVLGSISFAYVLRLTRDSVTENLSADWVRTATAKGLSRRKVVTTHVLRNSLIPVVTFLGADLGALMGGAIITEGIFNIPGVGHALYQAIIRGEGPRSSRSSRCWSSSTSSPACSSTSCTPSWTRGSAMSESALRAEETDYRPTRPTTSPTWRRPPLATTDQVDESTAARRSLAGGVADAAQAPAVHHLVADHPVPDRDRAVPEPVRQPGPDGTACCRTASAAARPGIRSASTSRAATSTPGSSTARVRR